MYTKFFKRLLDIILSFIGLIVLLIPGLIISILIVIEDGFPVFFTQKRVGINKTTFKMYKFRTMKNDAPHDVATHLLDDPDKYLTKVGKILRKTSLDELPQIINILFGHMSIIGPRPALWNQYDLIELRDKYNANNVRPGLTGWAQVNGRDELELEDKAKLDGEYSNNITIYFDTRIFFITIFSVLRAKGIVEGGTGKVVHMKEYSREQFKK